MAPTRGVGEPERRRTGSVLQVPGREAFLGAGLQGLVAKLGEQGVVDFDEPAGAGVGFEHVAARQADPFADVGSGEAAVVVEPVVGNRVVELPAGVVAEHEPFDAAGYGGLAQGLGHSGLVALDKGLPGGLVRAGEGIEQEFEGDLRKDHAADGVALVLFGGGGEGGHLLEMAADVLAQGLGNGVGAKGGAREAAVGVLADAFFPTLPRLPNRHRGIFRPDLVAPPAQLAHYVGGGCKDQSVENVLEFDTDHGLPG